MEKHTRIPEVDGLYWYWKKGAVSPEPVQIDTAKTKGAFRGFNGRVQRWLGEGEYLEGPQDAPRPRTECIDCGATHGVEDMGCPIAQHDGLGFKSAPLCDTCFTLRLHQCPAELPDEVDTVAPVRNPTNFLAEGS